MTLRKVLSQGWRRLLTALVPDRHQQLLALLRQQYAEEICDIAQLTQHAQRMHYPQFRDRLLQMAREDHTHAHWLREQIFALGGELPAVACPPPRIGKNSWECLRHALEKKKRSSATLLACIHQADRTAPTLAAELRRWRAQAKQHGDEIMGMMLKSDPSALPSPLTPHQEQQRQDWLAQQKSVWLEQERARWEADGRQTPWAEWVAEREIQWTTELPHRELEWVLRQAPQDTAELYTATESTPTHRAMFPIC